MGPQRRESSLSCNFCLSLKCCHWAIVGFTHFYEHHEHRTFNSSVCWYARVFRGIKRQSLRTNARVRSAGVKVAKTKWHVNSGKTDNFWNSANFISASVVVAWSHLQPFKWNMFHVRKQCCMSNDLLAISSSKRSFRHMYSLSRVGAFFFYSVNAICQVKMRKKWGQHMGPPSVCVCVCEIERETEGARGREFFPLYFGELERRLSSSLFPTNQVLPTCQPRRDARPFKTLC